MNCCSRSAARWWSSSPRSSEPAVDPAAAADRPLKTGRAAAEQPPPDPSPVGVSSRLGHAHEVGPMCELDRGHWACLSHRRIFRTRGSLDRHTRLGEHRLMLAVLGPRPRTARPRTRRPPRWPPSGDRTLAVCRWPSSASGAIAGRHSGQLRTRSQTAASHPLVTRAGSGAEGRSNLQGEGAPNRGRRHLARPSARTSRLRTHYFAPDARGATWGNAGPHSGEPSIADKDEVGGSSPPRPTIRPLTSGNAIRCSGLSCFKSSLVSMRSTGPPLLEPAAP